jgi:2-keto-4-pentenoate hydratase
MSAFDPAPAAAALHAARLARQPAGPLPPAIVPPTIADGIAVQVALAARMGALPPGGFKIGATAKRMQDYLGLSGPAAGFMPREGLHAAPATLAWGSFRGLGVECELAVRLAQDLPPGPCDRARAAAAVGALFAAIELVENRYGPPPAGDLKALGTPTLIADQVYHAAAVLAPPPADWRAIDLEAIPGRFLVDGVERSAGFGRDLLGHPLAALAWLAASPEVAAFGGLKAGQVVMLGSVTPPIWLDGPCQVVADFAGLPPASLHLA